MEVEGGVEVGGVGVGVEDGAASARVAWWRAVRFLPRCTAGGPWWQRRLAGQDWRGTERRGRGASRWPKRQLEGKAISLLLDFRWRELTVPQAHRRRNSTKLAFTKSLFAGVHNMVNIVSC